MEGDVMKLLYVSSGHPLLEADDCLTWDRLGIDWFSTGYYFNDNKPGDLPFIDMKSRDIHTEEFSRQISYDLNKMYNHEILKNTTWASKHVLSQFKFDRDFIDKFDVVFFSHFGSNVLANVDALRNARLVIIRTYGMHTDKDELAIIEAKKQLPNLAIVRTSYHEDRKYRKFAGFDRVIRQSPVKDEFELSGWRGDIEKICTFASFLFLQDYHLCRRLKTYNDIIRMLGRSYVCDHFGVGNNFISHKEKIDILRSYKVNLVIGTPHSANTYSFMEAWLMGQPVVCFGKNLWMSDTYEPDTLITHGVDGYICHNARECSRICKMLLYDTALAQQIGENGRNTAINIFGRTTISKQWFDFISARL